MSMALFIVMSVTLHSRFQMIYILESREMFKVTECDRRVYASQFCNVVCVRQGEG